MKNDRLKIGFLTATDPKDKKSLSGSIYYMANALRKHCGDVYYLGPLNTNVLQFTQRLNAMLSILFKKNYAYHHNIFLSKSYARIIEKKLKKMDLDIIFAPMASAEIAFLNTEIPVIYLSDATFALLNGYYIDYFDNHLGISKWEGDFIEKSAIAKADLLIYPSKWAACSALNDYNADNLKINVIPLGANLDKVPSKEVILKRNISDKCRLLFLGIDWERKGGKIAFDTFLELEKMGMDVELTVVGCIPPEEFKHERMQVIPFLDKNDEIQYKKLETLFIESSFLILPTRAEAYGIVFCESNAFGLPVITTDTGGVSSVITNGLNGFMLPIEAKGIDYAKLIYEIYSDEDNYLKLVKSSRRTFDEKLNWDKWGKEVCKVIEKKIKNKHLF